MLVQVMSAIHCTGVFTISALHMLYDHQRLCSAVALQPAGAGNNAHVLTAKLIAQLCTQAIPWTAFTITFFCIALMAQRGVALHEATLAVR